MGVSKLLEYELGDIKVLYVLDEEKQIVELMMLPQDMKFGDWKDKKQYIDSLIQLKIIGDTYTGGYAGGISMRQNESVYQMKYKKQIVEEHKEEIIIKTFHADDRGYEATHTLLWNKKTQAVRSFVQFVNNSDNRVALELLSSFSIGGISPVLTGDSSNSLKLHRIRSVWSMEGRLETQRLEDMALEPSWGGHAIRGERFGQVGSLAVNRYFPYMVLEDEKNDIFWGAQLAHNASWQMEVFRKDDGVSLSGGLADREFGQWIKYVEPGECFKTPEAILSVCRGGGIDCISQRMTEELQPVVDEGPESEQTLPIIFNEYCTTWGCPSHENISQILNAIEGKGFSYFVIDCGWFKEDGIPWDISMGDYEVSKSLFPEGMEKTVSLIREKGMKPGIWFEIENVGSASKAYQNEEHLLKRDGYTLTTTMRRFWDMRDSWVQDYLTDKVIGTLRKYQFDYMKIDCNDTIGLGCDGAESLGEGLRQDMEASMDFNRKVKKDVPGIIIENCASGGHRLEPLMMSESSMASFSDAHECQEIPIIAANLHRVILPRQSQIWSVIRKSDSLKRIAYSVANTFLGRMCISGDVMDLSTEQWEVLDRGIEFYQLIAPIIKDGFTNRFGTEIQSYRHPEGWQGIVRTNKYGEAFVLIHTFGGTLDQEIRIPLPDSEYKIKQLYSDDNPEVTIENGTLCYHPSENWKAVAVYLDFSLS